MIELAVFGAGRIGHVHALNAAAQPSVRLKYIVDPATSNARNQLAAKTGAALVDAETVFSDPDITGVVIASSTDTHAELLLRAVEAGTAVFCEKPVSLDFATVAMVSRAVEEAGIACLLGFQRRYDPNFRFVRDRIAGGQAGTLEHIVMHTRDPSPPPRAYVERSGGMFRDQAIHDFDMARYLLGEEIATVYAVGNSLIDPEIAAAGDIDTAMITLTSVSGRFVQMINCRRAPFGYDQRLEALCSCEVLYVENRPQRGVMIADAEGFHSSTPMNYFIERFADAYRAEMDAFVDLIETGAKPLATIGDGLEAQRLAEAAIVSMKTGTPVHITPDWHP
jgi:myo-inositol 2-dehydrogenase/D-chiro-inositol 1-dehydrogenase